MSDHGKGEKVIVVGILEREKHDGHALVTLVELEGGVGTAQTDRKLLAQVPLADPKYAKWHTVRMCGHCWEAARQRQAQDGVVVILAEEAS
jgi:hypothetical protein